MLKITAQKYIELGRQIADAELHYLARESGRAGLPIDEFYIRRPMSAMLEICRELGLGTSKELLSARLTDVPRTGREFKLLVDAIWAELRDKLFLYVPSYRAPYFDDPGLPLTVNAEFPRATEEMRLAGNCYALGQPTASVFHAMRAIEIGVHCMAAALGVTFSHPIELAEWGKIMGEIEPKIEALRKLPRSAENDANVKFYSEAASQFRHFNNGWRIRVSHARENYEEDQARKIIDAARSFYETLVERFSERP
jgi:hypothetical protein